MAEHRKGNMKLQGRIQTVHSDCSICQCSSFANGILILLKIHIYIFLRKACGTVVELSCYSN